MMPYTWRYGSWCAPARQVLVAIFVGALNAGCGPEDGGTCERESRTVCTEDAEMLVCEKGRWVNHGQRDEVGNSSCQCEMAASGDLEASCVTLH